ncbi:MAG: (deoxy)nucleoside triphosphate pyrophosphohydrolase [Myxococcales bacterium]|jgi:8-oxo-dGTP diphosphatase|nr:(deoxy)nucleoside triphosphate pyrophosphohydrolase [Myxococcales bacterium]
MRCIKTVVGALITRDGRYLITQRPAKAVLPLLWEFPGGKVEAGESDEAALRRELKELMGIEAVVHEQVLHVHHAYPDYDIDFRVYRCELSASARIAHLRIHDHRWVVEEALDDYDFPSADQKTLDQLLKTPI